MIRAVAIAIALMAILTTAGVVLADDSPLTPESTVPAEHRLAVGKAEELGAYLHNRYVFLGLARKAVQELPDDEVRDRLAGAIELIDEDRLSVLYLKGLSEGYGVLASVDLSAGLDAEPVVAVHAPPEALSANLRQLAAAQDAALAANPMNCVDRYTPIPLSKLQWSDGVAPFYLIADPIDVDVIALTGHSRVDVRVDDAELVGVRPFSVGCSVMNPKEEVGAGEEDLAFLMVSHVVSETPNEIHAFLNRLHGLPLIVGTDVGLWLAAAGRLGLVQEAGEDLDPERCAALLGETGPLGENDLGAMLPPPPLWPAWRERLVIGRMDGALEPPWRSDDRLTRFLAPGYPDDVSAAFINRENLMKSEMMWVSLVAFDAPTDSYLGRLLNQPHWMKTPRQHENVVVRFDEKEGILVGVDSGGNYSKPGRPAFEPSSLGARVYEGLVRYRQSEYGNNQDAIADCKTVLSEALQAMSPEDKSDRHLLWVGHYLLGRCMAEAYDTREAVEQFLRAIEFSPNDIHANMALLAEYSVLVHMPAGEDIGDRAVWREEFLRQLSRVRELGSDDFRVDSTLKSLFDADTRERAFGEAAKKHTEELTDEQLEYRRIFGWGVFRWKFP